MGYSVREEVWTLVMGMITFIILLGFHGRRSEACLREEREALLRVKEAFNHPNGHSLPSWNNLTSSSDCCTWAAIECDNSTNRVTKLLLDNTRAYELRDIKWSLNASSFLPFQQLQVLYLEGNYLTDSGLFGNIRLANLEVLSLDYNLLTRFPSFDLSHSLTLKHLWLVNNLLEGSIPESIMSLTSLRSLLLRSNNLTGSLPQQGGLCNLKNLQSLTLSNNKFEGQLPSCFSNLTSLHVLSLQKNSFEGIFPSSLFHALRSLVAIFVSDNYFSGAFSLSLLANHSNLKIIVISCFHTNLKLETENPPFIPSFQLRLFTIMNCTTLNKANNNKVPTFLRHQYDLLDLQLSHLNISGTFPSWILKNNTKLSHLNLTHNLFAGPFELNSTSELLSMKYFDISSNPIRDEIPSHIGFSFPNLISLDMSSTSLQGCIPASVSKMRHLNELDLSNNNLSGYLPQEFGQSDNELKLLKLSDNKLSGPCLPIGSNFTNLLLMDLSNNNFKGKFPDGINKSTKLKMLDLSANQLFGEIPNWIGNFQHLSDLILSKNSLTGSLPESFCSLIKLTYLDLSQNKFYGPLPSCLNMPLLKYLHLHINHFMGPLPSSLANSPLLTLDVRKNNFSGQVPRLLSSFSNLKVLILKENKLEGSIPIDLCELKMISILDLSQNKLSGRIPHCLNNITFGRRDTLGEMKIGKLSVSWIAKSKSLVIDMLTSELSINQNLYEFTLYRDQEVDFTSKRRYESYKGSILDFMSGLDVSENKLTGEIPPQIGYLSNIHTLNLSNNHFKGPIPETFSNLMEIESLDLSHNKLTGHIPAQLTQLYSLSVFSVAHNNLSGMTPDMKNQFSTFEPSSYEGNRFLCGPPLEQKCSSIDKQIGGRNKQSHKSETDDFRDAFLWSFGGAFVVFFLGVIAVLYLNPYICNCKLLMLETSITSYLYEGTRSGSCT